MVLETGGLLVGEEVRFSVDAEVVAAREAVGV
jgi:predicted regulator of Ras-like GTPase activity (Roadblock/LC7/MglB family)